MSRLAIELVGAVRVFASSGMVSSCRWGGGRASNARPPVGRLQRKPAIDQQNRAGREGGFIARQIKYGCRNLFGLAQASHRLALDEGLAGGDRVVERVDPVVERRGRDRA